MGCKRYEGCIICGLFQISEQLQTQIVKNRILSVSLLGNRLYSQPANNESQPIKGHFYFPTKIPF